MDEERAKQKDQGNEEVVGKKEPSNPIKNQRIEAKREHKHLRKLVLEYLQILYFVLIRIVSRF